jgi:hypothetical protein
MFESTYAELGLSEISEGVLFVLCSPKCCNWFCMHELQHLCCSISGTQYTQDYRRVHMIVSSGIWLRYGRYVPHIDLINEWVRTSCHNSIWTTVWETRSHLSTDSADKNRFAWRDSKYWIVTVTESVIELHGASSEAWSGVTGWCWEVIESVVTRVRKDHLEVESASRNRWRDQMSST